jgi:hypothetical protein
MQEQTYEKIEELMQKLKSRDILIEKNQFSLDRRIPLENERFLIIKQIHDSFNYDLCYNCFRDRRIERAIKHKLCKKCEAIVYRIK